MTSWKRTFTAVGLAAGLMGGCAGLDEQALEADDEGAAERPEHGVEHTGRPVAGTARVQTPNGVIELAYTEVDGLAIAEGDMVLGPIAAVERSARSAALITAGNLWPNGIAVYYDFDANMSAAQIATVNTAIAYWKSNTTVDLRPRGTNTPSDWIRFKSVVDGCYSDIGRTGGMQTINLDTGCTVGNLKHEIGHAMGLWHEQSRNDRNLFVTYTPACVQSGETHNFAQYSSGADLGAYDFGSIMHYGSDFFCADNDGDSACDCYPLTRKDGSFITPQRVKLSQTDLYGVAQLYGPRVLSLGSWHTSFGNSTSWPNVVKTTGDVNGDGKDDVVAFLRNTTTAADKGDVKVALSTGTSFGTSQTWNGFFCIDNDQCLTGDFNGDGKDDILSFTPSIDDVWVALSTGTSFAGTGSRWKDGFCYPGEVCRVADVNGDGKEDVISFKPGGTYPSKGDVHVALSTGASFGTRTKVHDNFCIDTNTCHVADMTSDGVADLVLTRADGTVLMAVGVGNGTFGTQAGGVPGATCVGAKDCQVADMNGDGRADVVSFWGSTRPGDDKGNVRISRRSLSVLLDGFRPERLATTGFCVDSEQCGVGDFNNDGRNDLIAFKPVGGTQAIWVRLSAAPHAGEL